MKRELAARDFSSPESMENVGILHVFPVFHTAPVGQKIRCSAEAELFRGSLGQILSNACHDPQENPCSSSKTQFYDAQPDT